jgi:hypothetical protein
MAMSELNTFASLGPTLLARKGGAKPAMRSHAALNDAVQVGQASLEDGDLDDLGWNDMGDDDLDSSQHEAEIVTLTPSGGKTRAASDVSADHSGATVPSGKRKPSKSGGAADKGHRAAFTLRLDGDRHLKLRLASTVLNRSAQDLVTEALDQFLAETPEIHALAAQVKRD